MTGKTKRSVFGGHFPILAAATMFFVMATAVDSSGAEGTAGNQYLITSSELPQRPRSVVKFSRLVAAGGTPLGTVVWYDDPATPKPADYLELYDSDGGLVAVAWFDRYGIERIAMDRAFVEGKDPLEGIFVALVDGDLT
ncbi:MAG: hypothetical protein ACM3SP_23170 [Chloroflexota bacterium]